MNIAVFFPGIGYTVDKPLLYYSKKMMQERGYEIVDIGYKGISKDCYNIMFLKDDDKDGKESYSLFSICTEETIGSKVSVVENGETQAVAYLTNSHTATGSSNNVIDGRWLRFTQEFPHRRSQQ